MKRPAIFFDRDNTLIVSDGYLADPAQVRLVNGAADAVARAREMGFATVVVSNQSGVARGLFGEDEVNAVNARLNEVLQASNAAAIVDRHEFCPFHPEGTIERYATDSELRKPKPGMILRAAEALDLDLPQSWVIGDAPRDIEAGESAGCQTILVRDDKLAASPAARETSSVQPDFEVNSLSDAIEVIAQATRPTHVVRPPVPGQSDARTRLEALGEQILQELRRRNEPAQSDFSVPKLLAGIVQVLALAALFLCYLNRNDAGLVPMLLFALVLQTLTMALLLMGRVR